MKNSFFLFYFALVLVLSGCVFSSGDEFSPSTQLADYGVLGPPPTKVSKILDREVLVKAIASTAASSKLRLIETLYRKGEGTPFPEYRIFGVEPGSAYQLLGLQNADVLIAANGYVLFDPRKFQIFVRLLENEDHATLHVRRGGSPILLNIAIRPKKKGKSS